MKWAGLGVQVLGRVRSDRVFYAVAPKRLRDGRPGRPKKHGTRFELSKPASLPSPDEQLRGHNPRYGDVLVTAWHGLHQKLAKQAGWTGFDGVLPIVAGTVIRIQVQRLPGDRAAEDLWLWHTAPPGTRFDLDLLWKAYLRRFDLEHTFRLLKSTLGWTAPQIRTPEQGQRWTWLILAAHTQLRLARTLTRDLRRPWEKTATRASRSPQDVSAEVFVNSVDTLAHLPVGQNPQSLVPAALLAVPARHEPATQSARRSPLWTHGVPTNPYQRVKSKAKSPDQSR